MEKAYLERADKTIKRLAKSLVHLPQRASPEILHVPPLQGGAGLLPVGDVYDMLKVAHGFKMLCSPDGTVRSVAAGTLGEAVQRRLYKVASRRKMAEFLSKDLVLRQSSAQITFWARVRSATTRLKTKFGLRWRYDEESKSFLVLTEDSNGEPVSTGLLDKQQLFRKLRMSLIGYNTDRLVAKPDQGKVIDVTQRRLKANHFLRSGSFIRFAEWRYIHRAHLGVLPLNAAMRWDLHGYLRCRRCGATLETLPHVLNHCHHHTVAHQLRHNNIQDRLVKACKAPGEIAFNRTVRGIRGEAANLRPDIVVRDEVDRRVSIIDVCVSFENRPSAFKSCENTNQSQISSEPRGTRSK